MLMRRAVTTQSICVYIKSKLCAHSAIGFSSICHLLMVETWRIVVIVLSIVLFQIPFDTTTTYIQMSIKRDFPLPTQKSK